LAVISLIGTLGLLDPVVICDTKTSKASWQMNWMKYGYPAECSSI